MKQIVHFIATGLVACTVFGASSSYGQQSPRQQCTDGKGSIGWSNRTEFGTYVTFIDPRLFLSDGSIVWPMHDLPVANGRTADGFCTLAGLGHALGRTMSPAVTPVLNGAFAATLSSEGHPMSQVEIMPGDSTQALHLKRIQAISCSKSAKSSP